MKPGFTALVLTLLAFPSVALAQVCLRPPVELTLGEGLGPGLNELITADFNRDGILDLAGTTSEANSVVVLIGTGNGGFGPPSFFPVGAFPASLVTADFNRDTIPDLAVVNNNSGTVSILLGTGAGDFTAGPTVGLSGFSSAIAVGDFNGDGRSDLAIPESGGVEILLADAAGGFHSSGVYPAGPLLISESLVADDFNGDGRLDVAVANAVANAVVVLLGDGIGGLGAPLVIPVGVSPFAVASGDFNHDGRKDLAVADRGTTFPLGSSDVAILLGTGEGTFSGPTFFTAGEGVRDVAVGDVNGDGNQDLAVANQFCCGTDVSAPAVSILLGDGSGSFGPPSNFAAGTSGFIPGPLAIVLADFNRDGRLDVAVADSGSRIWTYLACVASPTNIPAVAPVGLALFGVLIALVALGRIRS